MNIEQKLQDKGLELPKITPPVASYLPFVQNGNTLVISGQLPMQDGKLQYIGKVGENLSIEDGVKCAEICGLNILAQLKEAVSGDFLRVKKCLRLGIFVNSAHDFIDHPKVANGVSDLMVELFGDAGKHARAAVGSSSLPFGVAVEVDAIFEIK